jgi:hypothetical protein
MLIGSEFFKNYGTPGDTILRLSMRISEQDRVDRGTKRSILEGGTKSCILYRCDRTTLCRLMRLCILLCNCVLLLGWTSDNRDSASVGFLVREVKFCGIAISNIVISTQFLVN